MSFCSAAARPLYCFRRTAVISPSARSSANEIGIAAAAAAVVASLGAGPALERDAPARYSSQPDTRLASHPSSLRRPPASASRLESFPRVCSASPDYAIIIEQPPLQGGAVGKREKKKRTKRTGAKKERVRSSDIDGASLDSAAFSGLSDGTQMKPCVSALLPAVRRPTN